MDRYLKYMLDELEIKENYIDNEGRYVQYIEVSELNKIIENVVSIRKIEQVINRYINAEYAELVKTGTYIRDEGTGKQERIAGMTKGAYDIKKILIGDESNE